LGKVDVQTSQVQNTSIFFFFKNINKVDQKIVTLEHNPQNHPGEFAKQSFKIITLISWQRQSIGPKRET